MLSLKDFKKVNIPCKDVYGGTGGSDDGITKIWDVYVTYKDGIPDAKDAHLVGRDFTF